MSIPHNIFEKTVPIAKSKAIQYKKGPVKISAPSSYNNSSSPSSASSSDSESTTYNARTGDKRKSSSSSKRSSNSSRKRRVDDDIEMRDIKQEDVKMSPSMFLEKVRQDKEQKLNTSKSRAAAAVSFSAPTNAPSSSDRAKLSISDYRASRGLPPAVSNRGAPPPPQRQPNAGTNSNLFINKRKPTAAVSNGLH